jgi:hypothetical protein
MVFITMFESELWFLGECEDGELIVIGVPLHELLDDEAGHEGECLGGALAMVDRLLLAPVQLVQVSVLLDQGNEVRLHLALHLALPLLHRLLVLPAHLLAHLETPPDLSSRLPEVLLCKFGEVAILLY